MTPSASPSPSRPAVRGFELGAGRLDIFNLGNITLPLGPEMRAPAGSAAADRATVRGALDGHRLMPMQDALVRLPGIVVMVDAAAYDIPADSSYHVPGYVPPAPLGRQLAGLEVDPFTVRHFVLTHRHWDHFNGATETGPDGAVRPLFPNARHWVQRADWEHITREMGERGTREARTFTVLREAGLIEVTDGDVEIAPGVRLLAAPGETPGHQVVRVESAGQVAYLAGDMIHHPVEVGLPGFMVNWADEATNVCSRARVFAAAAHESALLMASHVPEVGRLTSIDGRPSFTAA